MTPSQELKRYYRNYKLDHLPQWVIFELEDKLRMKKLVEQKHQEIEFLRTEIKQLQAKIAK